MTLNVTLFDGGPPETELAAAIDALGATVVKIEPAPLRRLQVLGTRDEVEAIARLTEVAFIEETGEITLRNNTTKWVIQSNQLDVTSIWDQGLRGQGQIAGVIDSRMDMNSCYFLDPADNTVGSSHRKVVAYRSLSGQGAASHGTHVAGIVAGDQDPVNGTTANAGMAYLAKISFGNSGDIFGSGGSPSNLYQALENAYLDGARAHTNSWGDDGTTAYTSWCVDVDRFSYDYEDSLVLFAETNTNTLRTPENAKNLLAVGASRNGASAGQFCSGGVGPTSDGRRKPEIFAPGCSISSARWASACSTTSQTGTSMASPAVAGATLLARQYLVDGFYPSGAASPADSLTPSGALLKAMLLNSAVDMANTGGGPPPNDREGWGRVLLENALFFPGDSRRLAILADRRNADGIATGQSVEFPLAVDSDTETLKITLVFTDPAGALLASDPVVNDLDLVIDAPGGATYLGNVISSGASQTGGIADAKNNVEQVVLPVPAVGSYTVRVSGTAVNQGLQGFAVVATGDVQPTVGPFLSHASHAIDDPAPLGNADGVLDPGESVSLPVDLGNIGSADATVVSARLSSDRRELVKIVRHESSFPDIGRGQAATSNPPHYGLTLEPDATCGDEVRLTLSTSATDFEGETSWLVGVGRDRVTYPGAPLAFSKRGSFATTISVPDGFTIADVLVTLDIAHGDVGQLVVTLTSPLGVQVALHNRSSAGTADLVGTYDTELSPDGPGSLDDLNGQPSGGTWTLTVDDTTGGRIPAGALNGWSLFLRATAPFSCNPLVCGDPLPGGVGDTVLAEKSGSDLRMTWAAATDAAGYRVWKSTAATMEGEFLAGETASTVLVESDELNDLRTYFYRIRAKNGCDWEGP
jgi:subtilisin-like proprotein convertase family protein